VNGKRTDLDNETPTVLCLEYCHQKCYFKVLKFLQCVAGRDKALHVIGDEVNRAV